ncbi:hypothetical protein JX266_001634 [Neoarthrinium moseri]|nr:hypothetical protein JX266_001634 [Neoarthrinium moseri]
MPNAVTQMLTEVRTEYVIGTAIFVIRLFCKWKTRKWWWDDAFAVSAWVWFTLLYSMEEYLVLVGAPAAMDQAMRESFTDEQRENLRKGGIAMFASFYLLILLTWSFKGMLIAMFLRLTGELAIHRYVKIVAGVSLTTLIAALLTETLHCLPIERNWQILPDPGIECSAGVNTNIVIAVGNVLTDVLLLAVPPIIMRNLRMPLWRKLRILFLLSLGLFVIGMSLARCIMTVGNPKTVNTSSMWAQREAIVTIFAVNAPSLNVLFKRETWSTHRSSSGYIRDTSGSDKKKPARFEAYTMTNFETSSKGSTSDLVKPNRVAGVETHFSRNATEV